MNRSTSIASGLKAFLAFSELSLKIGLETISFRLLDSDCDNRMNPSAGCSWIIKKTRRLDVGRGF